MIAWDSLLGKVKGCGPMGLGTGILTVGLSKPGFNKVLSGQELGERLAR